MRIKREVKRSILSWIFLIIGGIFLILLSAWDVLGVLSRKFLWIGLSVVLVHFIRKTLFFYFDVEKEYRWVKEKDPGKAFLGISIILASFILGLFLILAFLF